MNTLAALAASSYDVLVVGGGATGAGVAWDAARRGLRVALVERGDFGGGTSSTSTKLAHGGVRYLEKAVRSLDLGQLRLVISALRERAGLLRAAPHLAHAEELAIPLRSRWQSLYYGIGLALYERLAGARSLGRTRRVDAAALSRLAPALATAGYAGGVLFFDGAFDDARFALELALSAESAGARVRSYTAVEELLREGRRVVGARVRDVLSGERAELRATQLVNCTGPWADALREMARPGIAPRLRPSQGIHVVLERSWWPGELGLLIPKTPDGRVLFALPFEGHLLVGTTDTEVRDLRVPPHASEADIAFVLETFGTAIGRTVPRDAVRAAWAGYRPLVAAKGSRRTEALIRDHEVEVWSEEGLLSVLGGKWTTYRAMAEDAVDRLCELRGERRPCSTSGATLLRAAEPAALRADPALRALPADIAAHLVRYGSAAPALARAIAAEGSARIDPQHPFTRSELRFCVAEEHVRTVDDLLDRRLRIGWVDERARARLAPSLAPFLPSAPAPAPGP
ncbi:MAG: glycerol-3-phosphate dehydrogenase/oxidase [Planctomycetes bacterium]|nr:glycerol-3-phosphate dehydrogenase/oxidase [Planctomycetota bacterium]